LLEIERLLNGETSQHKPQVIDVSVDQARVDALSPFHKAAFLLARNDLQRLDQLTREQLDTVRDIHAPDDEVFLSASALPSQQPVIKSALSTILPEPEAMIAVVRQILLMWVCYLLWINFRIPGDESIVMMAGSLGMVLATAPLMAPLVLFSPALVGVILAGILYALVMPHLSSFVGLGTMIFLATFFISYLFSKPQQYVTRSLIFVFFLMTLGLSNEQ